MADIFEDFEPPSKKFVATPLNVLKTIRCKISPTKKIEEEVKLQSYILIFLGFFAGEQYMKTAVKVSMKVQRITGALSRMSI